jgi:hypothetical protein
MTSADDVNHAKDHRNVIDGSGIFHRLGNTFSPFEILCEVRRVVLLSRKERS